jgi:hypothetical protein
MCLRASNIILTLAPPISKPSQNLNVKTNLSLGTFLIAYMKICTRTLNAKLYGLIAHQEEL